MAPSVSPLTKFDQEQKLPLKLGQVLVFIRGPMSLL